MSRHVHDRLCRQTCVQEKRHGWGYGSENGPSTWAAKYKACAGKQQSPIDINKGGAKPATISALEFHFGATPSGSLQLFNNGHSVQVQGSGLASDSTVFDGKTYKLLQFHFHRLSETTIDGKHFPLESHFVHKASDGTMMVVAVLFQYGSKNPTLDKLPWKGLDKKAGLHTDG